MGKWGQERKSQQARMPQESNSASNAERQAAENFKEQVARYNELHALQSENAEQYARQAMYANRSEYRQARGK